MKANIQVKYVNSKLTVFVDGKEVVPEKSSFLPTSSGFSVDIDVDTQGASDFTVSPELNIGNLAKDMPVIYPALKGEACKSL